MLIAFGFYSTLRLISYQSGDANYGYSLKFSTLSTNSLHFVAWLNDYPKGWQYGTPVTPKTQAVTLSLLQLGLIGVLGYFAARFRFRLFTYLFFIFIAALGPYYFLNRVLVFYLDLAYTALFLIISLGWLVVYEKSKKWGVALLVVLVCASLIKFMVYYPQWHQFSFVGVAQAIAANYLNTLEQGQFQKFRQICILDHQDGSWATENGQLATHLFQVPVISTNLGLLPKNCNQATDLILRNSGRTYHIIKP